MCTSNRLVNVSMPCDHRFDLQKFPDILILFIIITVRHCIRTYIIFCSKQLTVETGLNFHSLSQQNASSAKQQGFLLVFFLEDTVYSRFACCVCQNEPDPYMWGRRVVNNCPSVEQQVQADLRYSPEGSTTSQGDQCYNLRLPPATGLTPTCLFLLSHTATCYFSAS